MLVEAVYDNGRLLLPKQFTFVHSRFKIKVDVPDVEIVDCGNEMVTTMVDSVANEKPTDVSTVADLPDEFERLKMLRDKAFGPDFVYRSEESDSDIIHQRCLKKQKQINPTVYYSLDTFR